MVRRILLAWGILLGVVSAGALVFGALLLLDLALPFPWAAIALLFIVATIAGIYFPGSRP